MEVAIQKVELQEGVTVDQSCVLRKLVADKMVSRETIKSTIMQWWKPLDNLSIKVLGENMFLIEFADPRDKERVMVVRDLRICSCRHDRDSNFISPV
jgi:hypothetical protein